MKEVNFANTENEIIPYMESEITPYTGSELIPSTESEITPYVESEIIPYTGSEIIQCTRNEIIPYTGKEIIPYTTKDVVGNRKLHVTSENPRIGLTGLHNLLNTCFMNSVFQCLVNTELLKQYFLENHYKNDLNTENRFGSGGDIAILFGQLIKNIWSGFHKFLIPKLLINAIKSNATQFEGNNQHDAQELLIYLLDIIHEDLNRIKIRPEYSLETSSNEHKSENELADLAWQLHKSKNDSIIVDLFQGQYQSKLTCLTCLKSSSTFEPFSCLSLPLPERQVPYIIILFDQNPSYRPIKLLLTLKESATINDFFDELLKLTCINEKCLRILILDDAGHITYLTRETKTNFHENSLIFGFEVLDENQYNEPVVEFVVVQRLRRIPKINRCSCCKEPSLPDEDLKRCTKCYRAAYCDKICQAKHWPLHELICGKYTLYEQMLWPLVISLPVSKLTCFKITATILCYALQTIDVFNKETGETMNMQQIVNTFSFELTYIEDLNNCYEYGNTIENNKEQIQLPTKFLAFYYNIDSKMEDILVMPTQLELKNNEFRPSVPTLEQCFKLFTEPEMLIKDDSCYCDNCKTRQAATKTMTLSKLPSILIIQLKRFKYNYSMSYKIRDFVDYPIRFDLSSHKYNLYGVINHYGSLNGGHYTATVRCLSQTDEKTVGWRYFDDDYVEFIAEKDVVTSDGYLLFYQRQDLDLPVKIDEVITSVTEGGDESMGLNSLF